MTNKIVWRLKETPTSENLRELARDGILSKDEAREILFSSETEEDRDKKSLESEIKFLRELIEKLSERSRIVEVIKEVRVPYYQHPWYQPYEYWCGGTTTIPLTSGNMTYTTAGGASASTAGTDTLGGTATHNFSDIKTF